ncbi:MAG TPA: enoyl-CoA hydratase-related protein [Chloroflexota bacterium]|nr:enoyl-CoA hydratase-related protein [Chloroflexota bacterium]
MAYETILAETAEGVLTVTLNRPEVFNAFNPQMGRELSDALRAAGRDDEVRALVITGSGKAFCSGQDLKMVDEAMSEASPPNFAELIRQHYTGLILAMRRLEKPIVAAVNGVAAGAGMSLALASDLRIASDSATFLQAFVNIGLVPDSGSMYFLPRLVGLSKALELCLLGERVSAEEALRIGLVNRVVPGEELPTATAELARKLASSAGKALGLTKRGLNRALEANLNEMLEYEALLQEVAGRTADFREGVTAFKEKRAARFSGT